MPSRTRAGFRVLTAAWNLGFCGFKPFFFGGGPSGFELVGLGPGLTAGQIVGTWVERSFGSSLSDLHSQPLAGPAGHPSPLPNQRSAASAVSHFGTFIQTTNRVNPACKALRRSCSAVRKQVSEKPCTRRTQHVEPPCCRLESSNPQKSLHYSSLVVRAVEQLNFGVCRRG